MKWVGIAVVIALAVVIGVQVFTAQGAPSAPSVTLQGSLTPGSAQTATFTVTSSVYSVQPPNSIDLLGAKVQYAVWQNNVSLQSGSSALSVVSSSGDVYTMQATVSVPIPALCSSSGCRGAVDKVAFDTHALVSTYAGLYSSPTVNYTFQPGIVPTMAGNPSPNSAPLPTFLVNTVGMVLAGLAIGLFIVYAMGARVWVLPISSAPMIVAVAALVAYRSINGG